jgi:hypothetical protein
VDLPLWRAELNRAVPIRLQEAELANPDVSRFAHLQPTGWLLPGLDLRSKQIRLGSWCRPLHSLLARGVTNKGTKAMEAATLHTKTTAGARFGEFALPNPGRQRKK